MANPLIIGFRSTKNKNKAFGGHLGPLYICGGNANKGGYVLLKPEFIDAKLDLPANPTWKQVINAIELEGVKARQAYHDSQG